MKEGSARQKFSISSLAAMNCAFPLAGDVFALFFVAPLFCLVLFLCVMCSGTLAGCLKDSAWIDG